MSPRTLRIKAAVLVLEVHRTFNTTSIHDSVDVAGNEGRTASASTNKLQRSCVMRREIDAVGVCSMERLDFIKMWIALWVWHQAETKCQQVNKAQGSF